ncbi:DNA mismatch repair protein MSH7 [Capsicum chinense]|nr:DNA mismatch repair protein MSH7 [Capsicum chinense]
MLDFEHSWSLGMIWVVICLNLLLVVVLVNVGVVMSRYKVGRMEQLETSEQAKSRGSTSVIRRKLVHVLTPSTTSEGNFGPDAVHLLAVKETCNERENGSTIIGFAFVDCAALKVWVGSIDDDASCAALGALLMQVSPKEVIYNARGLSKDSQKALKKYSSTGPMGHTTSARSTLHVPSVSLLLVGLAGKLPNPSSASERNKLPFSHSLSRAGKRMKMDRRWYSWLILIRGSYVVERTFLSCCIGASGNHRTRAIREERLGAHYILSTMPIDEVLRFRSIFPVIAIRPLGEKL